MGCECNDYHPPIKLSDDLMIVRKEDVNSFSITLDEALELDRYFMECGYISHEFHEPVHIFIRRLQEFLKIYNPNVIRFPVNRKNK